VFSGTGASGIFNLQSLGLHPENQLLGGTSMNEKGRVAMPVLGGSSNTRVLVNLESVVCVLHQ